MKRACPCPAGDHSTRQWLTRSAIDSPPSFDRRTNEFSPVISTSCGSTICGPAISGALDDAHVALGGVAERAQRFLIARAVMGCRRLGDAVPFRDDGALVQAGFVGFRRRSAHEEAPA